MIPSDLKTIGVAMLTSGLPAMLTAASGTATQAPQTTQPVRPNIVYILADDLGWADIAYNNGAVPTPNIDKLAREGVTLRQHYVAPMCSPSRAALLSGRYWTRFGIYGVSATQVMPFDTFTLPRALKTVGYETALMGKWHLGSKPQWGPNHFGFDYSYGSLGGGTGPQDHRYKQGEYTQTWQRNGTLIEEDGHVTDLIANEAVRWIHDRGDAPFFLYVPFTAVHIPIKEPRHWLDRVPDGVVQKLLDQYEQLKKSQAEAFRNVENRSCSPELAREYAACIMHLDYEVGRIVAALEKTGKRQNTVIVFASDNGPAVGAENNDTQYPLDGYPAGGIPGSAYPLHGWKTDVYDGGIRTPAFVNWPGVLTPRTLEQVTHISDWMPTFCALTGVRAPKDPKWDGMNIWPFLTEERTTPEARQIYTAGRDKSLRDGDWKLIALRPEKDNPSKLFLYNLADDPNELNDLSKSMPSKVAELQVKLAKAAEADGDAAVPKQKK